MSPETATVQEMAEFVASVQAMRAAQKAWFADHAADNLIIARQCERDVDKRLAWLQCNRLPRM